MILEERNKFNVSVVIPVYNSQDFIENCVDSIAKQKTDISKIEILLINDGSSDDSDAICRNLCKKYQNIVYVKKENTGVSDTRNEGIRRARGKYIMLLDSDDYISEETIPNLINFFDLHYNEIDLVTYPMYWDRGGRISLHSRYSEKNYDKGTGIYDLDEYPGLNQSTVNIIIKNMYEDNLLYDTSMKLSEDQNFNTCILMEKNKIGYVKEAAYYYRRHGAGVSQTKNNPYYCFEDIMTYNEGLLDRFSKDGQASKYVQTLVINTFNWRVNTDELLPYHYSVEKLEAAKQRIANILKKINNEVIIEHSNCNNYVKIFFLKWKGEKLNCDINKNGYSIYLSSGEEVCCGSFIHCHIYKVRENNNNISIFASFSSPVLEIYPMEKYIIEGIRKDGTHFKDEYPIKVSKVPFRNSKMKTACVYPFTYKFNPEEIKYFSIKVSINGIEIKTSPAYLQFCGFIKKYHRESIAIARWRLTYVQREEPYFKVSQQSVLKELVNALRTFRYYPKKHVIGIFYYRFKAITKRKIWLYYDSAGVIDNGYYQFIHDFYKKDGVERYYILDGEFNDIAQKFNNEQRKFVVKHKSKKHKELFLKSSKIFTSFSSLSIYNPFRNVAWYSDVTHYQLIYLQHGILHASLKRMYAKEFTEIDKFVISSEFEKKNLIANYDYSEDDLIMSGMPRMGIQQAKKEIKNKILFAPSWRQYLIGQLVDNRRTLRNEDFIKSDFFIKINNFINSKELQSLLVENNLKLDFKLHPIFKEYSYHFKLENVPNVTMNFEKTVLEEYKLFITDFSSYQFDFVKLVRPVIYFLPDPVEMKAGIHSYRELDLKYEDAFGPLCTTSEELLEKLKKVVYNKFEVEEPYKNRMETFFSVSNDPAEAIYSAVIE